MIELDNVSLGYNHRPILRNVNMKARAGQILGLVGPNDSRRSTLNSIRETAEVLTTVFGYRQVEQEGNIRRYKTDHVENAIPEGMPTWREIATRVTNAIREIDPGKPVLFEPGPWGSPTGFDRLVPLKVDRVIYGFHMYMPHAFTHQGVRQTPVGIRYPGKIGGEFWDKERLREAMLPAIDFQRTFNVHIHVGEFSAIRWAPDNSAYRYLRDVIELFEEYGWDWTYHAFREWDGWSVEHGPDPENHKPSETPTQRQKLLLDWFAKNEKPEWFRREVN
ncbi:MAG: cellulase family glycosylhydrolase [Candidatus Hydrogenedentota bacterium]